MKGHLIKTLGHDFHLPSIRFSSKSLPALGTRPDEYTRVRSPQVLFLPSSSHERLYPSCASLQRKAAFQPIGNVQHLADPQSLAETGEGAESSYRQWSKAHDGGHAGFIRQITQTEHLRQPIFRLQPMQQRASGRHWRGKPADPCAPGWLSGWNVCTGADAARVGYIPDC